MKRSASMWPYNAEEEEWLRRPPRQRARNYRLNSVN